MLPQSFQLIEYQWKEGRFDTQGKLISAHRVHRRATPRGGVLPAWWVEVGCGGPRALQKVPKRALVRVYPLKKRS